MSGLGARLALLVGSLAAAGAGWVGARHFGDEEAKGTVVGAIDLYECPAADGSAVSIGQLHAGDRVWLIGITDDRWAIIRHPDDPDRPAWVPLAMVDTAASAGELPRLTCADAVGISTTAVQTSDVTTSVSAITTTTLPFQTTSSSSSTSTSTTIASDVTPPVVTVTADRAYLYALSSSAPCSNEDALVVTIAVADPTLPLSIRSIVANWSTATGPQSATLVPIGGNRFNLEIAANGPSGGETPLTLTATGADGAGNVGTGQLVVSLRDPHSFGCP